jgi:hypothetical protein
MGKNEKSRNTSCEEYLDELSETLSDSVHKRLIKAYKGEDPVTAMESELKNILSEVLRREN